MNSLPIIDGLIVAFCVVVLGKIVSFLLCIPTWVRASIQFANAKSGKGTRQFDEKTWWQNFWEAMSEYTRYG